MSTETDVRAQLPVRIGAWVYSPGTRSAVVGLLDGEIYPRAFNNPHELNVLAAYLEARKHLADRDAEIVRLRRVVDAARAYMRLADRDAGDAELDALDAALVTLHFADSLLSPSPQGASEK